MEETTEFGIVCKPESSNVAGRPMAKRSRAEESVGGGGSDALALSLQKIVRSSKQTCCAPYFSCVITETHLRDEAIASSYMGSALGALRLGRRAGGGAAELAPAPIVEECATATSEGRKPRKNKKT
jgi:hypothetical protein